ncbi:MAG: glutathione peroxidase [Bdellovibrionales bacterium]
MDWHRGMNVAFVLALMYAWGGSLVTFATENKSTVGTPESLHQFHVQDVDGKSVDLGRYKGKVVLVVNTASKCGYTPQLKGLQELYEEFKDSGFVVLAFPSPDFGGQEPGANPQIKAFCQTQYGVEFPLMAKGPVKGPQKQPVFKFLTESGPEPGEIQWNFEKFLVSPEGRVVRRFRSKVTPADTELRKSLQTLLKKTKL